ncbi:hypothetical protein [Cecembia rubra]|uniref:Uncharacterized protein n=1 Tax=Cecembia rubra TaxID=1485585 RepID=A0A2P8E667_9BACT|nr:hypothetical protein [Cecembia rubra]PSL04966.1 hypothetical protein CLV48_104140 [Cecembia rubra]
MKRKYSFLIVLFLIFVGYLSSYFYVTFIQDDTYTVGIYQLFYYFFWVPIFYFLMLFFLKKTVFGPFKDVLIYFFLGLLFITYNYIKNETPFLNDVLFLILGTFFLIGIVAIVSKIWSKNRV